MGQSLKQKKEDEEYISSPQHFSCSLEDAAAQNWCLDPVTTPGPQVSAARPAALTGSAGDDALCQPELRYQDIGCSAGWEQSARPGPHLAVLSRFIAPIQKK